ncbi:MAG: carboxypeptidase M32 [Candidatus Kapabacteria bacterium]|nr:carboxypeptidase M32 [Candidatus Kapabacteria bacterium]
MSTTTTLFESVSQLMNKIKDIQATISLLGWDQEVNMPTGSAPARAEHISTLSSISHELITNDSAKSLFEDAKSHLDSYSGTEKRLLTLFIEEFEQNIVLPMQLIKDTAKARALGQTAWRQAYHDSDYSLFQPYLQRLLDLKIEAAEHIGYKEHRYDAMLDNYEKGATVTLLTPIFEELRQGTIELLQEVDSKKEYVNRDFLHRTFEPVKQLSFAKQMSERLGFDFNKGRIDLSTHPFCTSFSPIDVRITTRVSEDKFHSCFFGVIHETGHALYEQGVNQEIARTFAGGGSSLGIHESQSLFWENYVCRSEEYWMYAFPILKKEFPDQFYNVNLEQFFKAINKISTSLNRVESDEITYNLHIILRFEIEKGLFEGSIRTEDIPEIWNTKMNEYLSVVPENDKQGCLQDVHWSFGGFGYFPTYTLGKLYGAMFWNQINKDIPKTKDMIAQGNFTDILQWLRTNIHQYGRLKTPQEIVKDVTGRPLTATDFLEYAKNKVTKVYGA